jgi:hypothetical protein
MEKVEWVIEHEEDCYINPHPLNKKLIDRSREKQGGHSCCYTLHDSQFLIQTLVLSINKRLMECCPKLRVTATHLHIDNSKSHPSKISIQKIEESGFIQMPQSVHSHSVALCKFFLFAYLKDPLQGREFSSEAQVISAARQILEEIPIEILCKVTEELIHRLR